MRTLALFQTQLTKFCQKGLNVTILLSDGVYRAHVRRSSGKKMGLEEITYEGRSRPGPTPNCGGRGWRDRTLSRCGRLFLEKRARGVSRSSLKNRFSGSFGQLKCATSGELIFGNLAKVLKLKCDLVKVEIWELGKLQRRFYWM